MRELRVVKEGNVKPFIAENVVDVSSSHVTMEQLDTKINGVVEKIANRLEPASALTPEVRGMVKAVSEVQSLKEALKDPTSAGIETATSNLVTTVLGNALQNISGGGQQAPQAVPLRNTLAQLAVNNLTSENSPLPQLLDALTNVLGKDKVREGYDSGMKFVEQQQNQSKLPNIILQLDENNQEDVVIYAQQMGYTDVGYAQTRLLEHKNMLLQEVEEYQRVQQGGQQAVAEEPIRNEPQEQYYEEPIIEEAIIEEPIIEEPIIEEPIQKDNKVIILHSKPKKLKVISNDGSNKNNSGSNKNESNKENDILDIDNIINELGEQDESKKT